MRGEAIGQWGLRIAGSIGLAIFAFVLFLTWHTPEWVETLGKDFIAREAAERVNARIDAIGPPRGDGVLQRAAAELYERNAERVEVLKLQLKDRTRNLFLAALDQVRDLDCSCRQRIEVWWQGMNLAELAALATDNQRMQTIVHGGYMSVVDELRREIRIFAGTNAAAFLLLLLVSFAKPAAARHLLFPGVLLLLATAFCAFLYVTSQDWLLTLIHGNYVGWAYAACLALVFGFLLDIALNRGRVTAHVGNGISSVFGGIFSALTPC